jgi:ubiquinone/menaquinone biosynthesis C-methylase UbiE
MGQSPHEAPKASSLRSAHAIDQEADMTLMGRFFAAAYDRQNAKAERAGLGAMREGLLAGAAGRVLEIGAGTGSNLAYYGDGDGVATLTLTEPEPPMLRRLQEKVRRVAPSAMILRAPAEDLPFPDGSFDVVVSTLVLCGVSDQQRALREIRRVLRTDGRLLFLEHVRSDDPKLARRQERMNGINRFLVGCECTRPTLDSIRDAGFVVERVEHATLPKAPSFVRPAVVGSAVSPAGAIRREPQPAAREQA